MVKILKKSVLIRKYLLFFLIFAGFLYFPSIILAQWGSVSPPPGVSSYGNYAPGLSDLVSNIVKLIMMGAGIFALFNFLIAGYTFMGAGGDPKKIADAWGKIWQTVLGLIVAIGAFVIASIIGYILYGEWGALTQITIYGP